VTVYYAYMFDTPLGHLLLAFLWLGAIYGFIVLLLVAWNREERVIRSDNDSAKDWSHNLSLPLALRAFFLAQSLRSILACGVCGCI